LTPARALNDWAEAEHADLIVVGSTHHGPVGRLTSGTTAQRLLEGAPCAVAVAPNGYRSKPGLELRPVGVAYDGSREAKLALAAGRALVPDSSGELRVIGVFSPAATVAPLAYGWATPPDASNLVYLRDAFREMLEHSVSDLSIPVDVVVREGDPARELIAESELLGVLLMGARSYGPLRRVLLGRVSARVTCEASCPVIVVPRAAHGNDQHRSGGAAR
jgi:nucleotide-binding universal stress UspA family protein